jgi:hypothetical protein
VFLEKTAAFIDRVEEQGQYGRNCRDTGNVGTRNLSEVVCSRGKYWWFLLWHIFFYLHFVYYVSSEPFLMFFFIHFCH